MIVIIDDDFAYNEALIEFLNSNGAGYEFQTFETGGAAIEWFEARGDSGQTPEVIILDMMLPWDANDLNGCGPPPHPPEGLGGLRVLNELIRLGIPTERILVISATRYESVKLYLTNKGVPDHHILWKPARTGEIDRLVAEIYTRSQR